MEFVRSWFADRAIRDLKTRVFAVTAGLGSGKTHGACDWHIDRCILNNKSAFSAFLMPTYQKIHDAAIPTFRKVFAAMKWNEGERYHIVKTPFPKIVLPRYGHEIHFISGTRPDKIVAVEYSHATISEAGSIDYEAFKLLRTRIRCPRAAARQLMIEGVTMGVENFFARLFDSVGPDWIEYKPRDYINLDRKFRRFRLSTYDNEFRPDDYIANLLDTFEGNQNYIKAWIFGHFCPLVEGSAYKSYSPAVHDCEDIDPIPGLEVALTFDFNANPLAFVALQRIRTNHDPQNPFQWIAQHEASNGFGQLDDVCVEFATKYPVDLFFDTPITIYGDSSGHAKSHKVNETDFGQIKKYLKELGYRRITIEARKSNPLETVSVEALNRMFQLGELAICKRCKNLRSSLLKTRWREGVRKLYKPAGETWTHFSDAAKYFAYVLAIISGRKFKALN